MKKSTGPKTARMSTGGRRPKKTLKDVEKEEDREAENEVEELLRSDRSPSPEVVREEADKVGETNGKRSLSITWSIG
jgi:fructose-1,6-bisphosphatase/inositol monophosphatase family enzyme